MEEGRATKNCATRATALHGCTDGGYREPSILKKVDSLISITSTERMGAASEARDDAGDESSSDARARAASSRNFSVADVERRQFDDLLRRMNFPP
jgi:hypothetical protein